VSLFLFSCEICWAKLNENAIYLFSQNFTHKIFFGCIQIKSSVEVHPKSDLQHSILRTEWNGFWNWEGLEWYLFFCNPSKIWNFLIILEVVLDELQLRWIWVESTIKILTEKVEVLFKKFDVRLNLTTLFFSVFTILNMIKPFSDNQNSY
jgi:hypothetical protein